MADTVLPFDPKRRRKGQPPKPPASPAPWLSRQARGGTPEAQRLAAEQASRDRGRYAAAAGRQRDAELLAEGTPVPARITMALDVGGHEGPEVDLAVGTFEGNPAGDVDVWECGLAVPSAEQVKLLAVLTGFAVRWFYEPMEPGPLLGGDGRMWICGRGGCESPEPVVIDERGVLHYGGETRQPPEWWANGQPALF